MSRLRELLKQHEPSLYEALEKSWDIAHNEIFPAIPPGGESLNSYPHVRNLENYLNTILPTDESLFNIKSQIYLTPYELYAILSAILFHDIGRIISGNGHGTYSKLKILDNYIRYGIPTRELAKAIGDICEYHEPLPDEDKEKDKEKEKEKLKCRAVLLDADKGYIRVEELGALLVLVDEMDNSYNRLVLKEEIAQLQYNEMKSIFRSVIKGVTFDKKARAIIVALGDYTIEKGKPEDEKSYIDIVSKPDKEGRETIINPTQIEIDIENHLLYDSKINPGTEEFSPNQLFEIVRNGARTKLKHLNQKSQDELKEDKEFLKMFSSYFSSKPDALGDIQILQKIYPLLHAKIVINDSKNINTSGLRSTEACIKCDIGNLYPSQIIYAVAIGSINLSHKKITKESRLLARLGIYVNAWLLFYDEQLYNHEGYETFEPIFNKDYLIKIAKLMWKLSTQIFGQGFITYENLASAALETDIEKIKMAVRRISIFCEKDAGLKHRISFDGRGWSCAVMNGDKKHGDDDIEKIIKDKKTPHDYA